MAQVKITETILRDAHQSLIATRMTMDEMRPMLKAIDEVAYVRFASVYRQFRDINTFMEELSNLLKEK